MKKIILGLGLTLMGTFVNAQNGLDTVIVEKYYVSTAADTVNQDVEGVLPVGSVTYRIFVGMKPGYNFQGLFGTQDAVVSPPVPLHTLIVNTSTTFFNNIDRGNYNVNNIGSTYLNKKSVALDSWFSVGAAAGGQFGVLKSEDNGAANLLFPHSPIGMLTNTVSSIGIPLATQDGIIAGSPQSITFVGDADSIAAAVFGPTSQGTNSFSTSNGTIASLNYSTGPTASNRVLVGQFTTDGAFHMELNIQIGTPSGGTQTYVARNPVGNEISFPYLIYPPTGGGGANIPPTVSITSPASASSYTTSGTVNITASASDADGIIDSVEFFVDGVKIGKALTSPYIIAWASTVGTHTLTAIATDNNGAHTTSSAVIVTIAITGINDITASASSFSIYPNPANDVITIEINTTQQIASAGYAIYDIIGTEILNKKLGTISGTYKELIDVSALSKGLYLIKMNSDGATSTKKIIIH